MNSRKTAKNSSNLKTIAWLCLLTEVKEPLPRKTLIHDFSEVSLMSSIQSHCLITLFTP